MALEETKLRTRRALLAGATAGAAVLAAEQLARPLAMRAVDGDPVILGQVNGETSTTQIVNNATEVLNLESTGDGFALKATSIKQPAIACYSEDGCGIRADSDHSIGVLGSSMGTEPSDTGDGVVGFGTTNGVSGQSDGGCGVSGFTYSGVGVGAWVKEREGESKGIALAAHGPVLFDSAGRVTIPQGARLVTVHPPVELDVDGSKILVTLLGSPEDKAKKATPICLSHVQITDSATFDIVLTDAAGRQVDAAYFIIS
jgi:hypothetical protein